MSSFNELGRGEKPITKFGMGMQLKDHLLPTFAKTLLNSKIIHNRSSSRGGKRIRMIQINPFGDILKSGSLFGSHLLLGAAPFLLLGLRFLGIWGITHHGKDKEGEDLREGVDLGQWNEEGGK